MKTLEQNIMQAISDFDEIKSAIEEKGIEVPLGTDTSQYGNKVRLIGADEYDRGYAAGYEDGNTEGYTKGHTEGVEQGYADCAKETQALEDGFVDKNFPYESYTNERVKRVGEGLFYFSKNIKNVSFPNAEEIGKYAFRGCSSLTKATFGDVTSVGQEAFYGAGLTELNFQFLDVVDANTFREMRSLERADFGMITTIGTYAFYYCNKLTTFIIRTPSVCSLPQTTSFMQTGIANKKGYIYVPDNLVEQYKTATNWSAYADQIKSLSELE